MHGNLNEANIALNSSPNFVLQQMNSASCNRFISDIYSQILRHPVVQPLFIFQSYMQNTTGVVN